MKIILKNKPKNVTIIEGFPGFGLVGSISTEFLIQHLDADKIGIVTSEKFLPITAVHDGQVVEPLSIYYSKKYNIVIVHALSGMTGLEWSIAEMLGTLCKTLSAKELISIEGIMSKEGGGKVYYYSNIGGSEKKLKNLGVETLKEGIIMGVTGALITNTKNHTGFFVESNLQVADSMAAARIIETLDKYLGLKVDTKPLQQAAAEFEGKLKNIMEQSKAAVQVQEKKSEGLNYLG